jgi:hypothetical protein
VTLARFIVGDFLSVLAIGAIVGALCVIGVAPGWSVLLAMALGMIGGMALGFAWSPLVGIWLGAHEAMIPAMLTGMIAGMIVAMRAANGILAASDGAIVGAAIGIACLLFTYAMNAWLGGEQTFDRSAK